MGRYKAFKSSIYESYRFGLGLSAGAVKAQGCMFAHFGSLRGAEV